MVMHTLVPPASATVTTADPVRGQPAGARRASTPAERAAPLVIAVGLPVIPDEVDRAQLVIRGPEGGITMLDNERWAEPLKSGLPRALALALSQRLPEAIVASYPGTGLTTPTWRLTLEVQRFELRRSPSPAATLRAVWSLRQSSGAEPARGRLFDITLPAPADQRGLEGAVAAMTVAVGRLADEVAQEACRREGC
jgi:uncharacterized lipoprotein YmbA